MVVFLPELYHYSGLDIIIVSYQYYYSHIIGFETIAM